MIKTYNSYLPESILLDFMTDEEKRIYYRKKRCDSDYDTAISIMEETNRKNK